MSSAANCVVALPGSSKVFKEHKCCSRSGSFEPIRHPNDAFASSDDVPPAFHLPRFLAERICPADDARDKLHRIKPHFREAGELKSQTAPSPIRFRVGGQTYRNRRMGQYFFYKFSHIFSGKTYPHSFPEVNWHLFAKNYFAEFRPKWKKATQKSRAPSKNGPPTQKVTRLRGPHARRFGERKCPPIHLRSRSVSQEAHCPRRRRQFPLSIFFGEALQPAPYQ